VHKFSKTLEATLKL